MFEKIKEVLRPFAQQWEVIEENEKVSDVCHFRLQGSVSQIKVRDCKKAYELLRDIEKEDEFHKEDVMPRIKGETFRCSCGCNVFRKSKNMTEDGYYKFRCNSCLFDHEGK